MSQMSQMNPKDDKVSKDHKVRKAEDDALFRSHMAARSRDVLTTLLRHGIPPELRDKIMSKTPYDNSVKRSIEFFKENVGEVHFLNLIFALSEPEYVNAGHPDAEPLLKYPSWLIKITKHFINLFKLTPNLPPVLGPFREILDQYVPEMLKRSPYRFTPQGYIQKCNEIVEQFITAACAELPPTYKAQIAKFFRTTVSTLLALLEKNKPQIDSRSSVGRRIPGVDKTMEVRMRVKATCTGTMLPIFQKWFTLNVVPKAHEFIRTADINLKEWVNYAKLERARTIEKIMSEDPVTYRDYDDWDWNNELKERAGARDEARHSLRSVQFRGGRKHNTTRLRSRGHKKRTCKLRRNA